MITFSKLGQHGQLGNQMFQYAMLLGVSEKKGYDISIPKKYHGRKRRDLVELQPFRITAHTLNPKVPRFKNRYEEQRFNFNPEVFDQPDWTDYNGYYQSERYFLHCNARIREEFRFCSKIESYAKDYVFNLREESNVVAIHVRRGDYLKHPNWFQILTPDYYKRAMNHSALPADRQFLVFSDDLIWCAELRGLSTDRIALVHSPDHWHDLAIMTYCDAHIISASSFSWWGAWLCHNRNNPVICPTPWFPPGGRLYDTRDIIPKHWHQLEV